MREKRAECQKSGGAVGTASCRGYRGGAPNPCAAALSPQTSLRVRSTEDEDSPKGYRSPKPATLRGAGRKALFAGSSGQLGVFRQAERFCLRREKRSHFIKKPCEEEHANAPRPWRTTAALVRACSPPCGTLVSYRETPSPDRRPSKQTLVRGWRANPAPYCFRILRQKKGLRMMHRPFSLG